MAQAPRQEIEEMISGGDLRGLLEKATEFHGHYCHKVAYGVKAGALALRELGIKSTREEEGRVATIVDSPGPFCNGIQVVTGLTVAHSDFVVRDLGKLALTLLKGDGSAVRVALRPQFLDNFPQRNPELAALFGGGKYATIAVPEEETTPLTIMRLMGYLMEKMGIKEEEQMKKMAEQMMGTIKAVVLKELEIPEKEMFKVDRKKLDFSEYAPVCQCTYPIVVCDSCGETVFEPYIRTRGGKSVCLECAGEDYGIMVKGKIARATTRI